MTRTPVTLQALCDSLNAFVPSHDNERLEDTCDLADLPTYGGEAPADTREIWSWDAQSLLRFSAETGDYYIEPRPANPQE